MEDIRAEIDRRVFSRPHLLHDNQAGSCWSRCGVGTAVRSTALSFHPTRTRPWAKFHFWLRVSRIHAIKSAIRLISSTCLSARFVAKRMPNRVSKWKRRLDGRLMCVDGSGCVAASDSPALAENIGEL